MCLESLLTVLFLFYGFEVIPMITSFSFSCILIGFIEWEEKESELLVDSHNLKPI